MKLKKGDIVEIIEKDTFDGMTYNVGSKWTVTRDHQNNMFIQVYDPRYKHGVGLLSPNRIKQVDLPKQDYKFEVGQVYKVISQGKESPFSYDKTYVVRNWKPFNRNYISADDGIKYYGEDFGEQGLVTEDTYLELIGDAKEPTPKPKTDVKEPTIEVNFLLEYIEKEDLSSREIEAFLKGYLKGERFKND